MPLSASISMSEDGLESGVFGVNFGFVLAAEKVFVDPEEVWVPGKVELSRVGVALVAF